MKFSEYVFRVDVEINFQPILEFNQIGPTLFAPFIKQANGFKIEQIEDPRTIYNQDNYRLFFTQPISSLNINWSKISQSWVIEPKSLFSKSGDLKLFFELFKAFEIDSVESIVLKRNLFFPFKDNQSFNYSTIARKLIAKDLFEDSVSENYLNIRFNESFTANNIGINEIHAVSGSLSLQNIYGFTSLDNPNIANKKGVVIFVESKHNKPYSCTLEVLENDYKHIVRSQERIVNALQLTVADEKLEQ